MSNNNYKCYTAKRKLLIQTFYLFVWDVHVLLLCLRNQTLDVSGIIIFIIVCNFMNEFNFSITFNIKNSNLLLPNIYNTELHDKIFIEIYKLISLIIKQN